MTKLSACDQATDSGLFINTFDAVTAIEQFTTGIELETLSQNLEKVFAVSRAIEIIGEAMKRILDSVRSQQPDIFC